MPRSPSPFGRDDRDRKRYDDRDRYRNGDDRDRRGEASGSGRTGRSDPYDDRRERERERRRGRSRSRSRSPAPRRRSRSPPSKSRSRSRDRSSRHAHRRRRSRSRSRSSTSSSDSDGSDRHRKKKKHRRDRSRSRSRERKESKEEKRERKRLKRKKKEEKKAKKAAKSGRGAIGEYGKYGIISETDIYTKDAEFRAWLVEEKMLNPETVAPAKSKELFRTFMEDFNTGTLPHQKFYALEAYERRMNAIKAGETVAEAGSYDPRADELALSAAQKRPSKPNNETYLAREQLEELRKIERERVEASRMKRMGMDVKETMGVRFD